MQRRKPEAPDGGDEEQQVRMAVRDEAGAEVGNPAKAGDGGALHAVLDDEKPLFGCPPAVWRWRLPVLVWVVAFATRYYRYEYPNTSVFDEVHFGRFASLYIQGTLFFDIHPPFGKLVLMWVSKWAGYDGHFDFHNYGARFDGDFYLWMRLPAIFFGSLIPVFAFLATRQLGASNHAALFAGALVIFDNCYLVESRLILTDACLLCFQAMSVWAYVLSRNQQFRTTGWYGWLATTGVALALCCGTKWTGVPTMAAIGLDTAAGLFERWSSQSVKDRVHDWGTRLLLLLVIPMIIYIGIWELHIYYLPKVGPGANMYTPEFLKRLEGNTEAADVVPVGDLEAIWQFHKRMYVHNQAITTPHGSMSGWWSWPLLLKGMPYWGGQCLEPGKRGCQIFLLGNPFVWWGTSIGLVLFTLYGLAIPFRKSRISREETATIQNLLLAFGGYVLNMLMYVFVKRVTFLYHYLPSLFWAIILVVVGADAALAAWQRGRRGSAAIVGGLWAVALFVVVAGFVYFSPLSYGFPVDAKEREAMRWLEMW